MRKLILVVAGIAVLATAGLALAKGTGAGRSVQAVAGTFTATTATRVQTKTCTTTDGKTLAVTVGTYTGTATGDPDLSGPITLVARSTIDTTDNVGFVTGRLKIDVATGKATTALYNATYLNGTLVGQAAGTARDPKVRLLGSVSAGFTGATGFTDGKIGGTAAGSAIEVGRTVCVSSKGTKEQSSARGTVSAISPTSITVAGLTCSMSGDTATNANHDLAVGDRAQIQCQLVDGANTLVKYTKKK